MVYGALLKHSLRHGFKSHIPSALLRLKLGGAIRGRTIVVALLSPINAKDIQNDYACTPRFIFVQQISFTNYLKKLLKNMNN